MAAAGKVCEKRETKRTSPTRRPAFQAPSAVPVQRANLPGACASPGRELRMLSSRLFVSLARRRLATRLRAPAFADQARVAAAVTAAAVAAAASAASEPSIAEGDEFARWAAELRGRPNLADREVDFLVHGPHDIGRLGLAAHRLREATLGGRQFIWETCRDGDHRIKQVAVWRWLERDDLLDAMMETTPTTATSTKSATATTSTSSATTATATATATATETDTVTPVLPGQSRLSALVEMGSELTGHPGVIHGGFTAALLDDLFGWAAGSERKARNLGPANFTANLDVNYRRPLFAGSTYLVEVRVDRVEKSKKIYLSATLSDAQGRACVEATSLYIVAKPKLFG